MAVQSSANRVASTTRTISSTAKPATCQVSGEVSRSRRVMVGCSLIADLLGAAGFAAGWEPADFAEVSGSGARRPGAGRVEARERARRAAQAETLASPEAGPLGSAGPLEAWRCR